MKFFEASVETIYWRLILLMAVVIAPFFMGIPWLALLALPVFLSTMLGVSFKHTNNAPTNTVSKNIKEESYLKKVA